jgi:hypothetical protein
MRTTSFYLAAQTALVNEFSFFFNIHRNRSGMIKRWLFSNVDNTSDALNLFLLPLNAL